MRLSYLLLPFTLVLLAMTSGCHHHRHCCCGGCVAPCCAPVGTCCGYTPSVEGPMPPLAPQAAPAPLMPMIGSR